MKVSIITATYNSIETIEESIKSVLSQDYQDIEFIIVDGCSTDGTKELLKKYNSKIDRIISEPDKGIYDALNKGINLSTGDIIGFMHSDDLFHDSYVIKNIANSFQEKNIDGIYGDLIYVKKDNPDDIIRYWKAGKFSNRKLKLGWMPPHPTLYLRKKIYNSYGCFDTSYKIAADYDFILRVLSKPDVSIKYLPNVFVKMRVGGASNRSIKNILEKSNEDYKAIKSNSVGGLHSLIFKNIVKLPQFIMRKKIS